ncbi:MAG: patatin-like phospholipase family protein [Gammaproteobacteria bacterium]
MLFSNSRIKHAVAAVMLVLLAGCASTPERNPPPENLVNSASIPWVPDAREWADDDVFAGEFEEWLNLPKETIEEQFPDTFGKEHTYLALSGGGQNGAFGAGLLYGWTESGTRPEFTLVTGVSTGAIIAPFAYLGPEFDWALKEIYTGQQAENLLRSRGLLKTLFGESASDSEYMREKIVEFIDQSVMEAIAQEYLRGRSLNVVTTNLDAGRPVSWDIGAIAASGHPDALELIQDAILASASIPGIFPPVMFDVEADGETYEEMHVDGGATSIVHLYPIGLDFDAVLRKLEVPEKPELYIVRNGNLRPSWEPVQRSTIPIALRSVESLMRGVVQGDIYRIYLASQRDGIDFNLAYIPDDFSAVSESTFDSAYMQELFQLGRKLGAEGYDWQKQPPGVNTGK